MTAHRAATAAAFVVALFLFQAPSSRAEVLRFPPLVPASPFVDEPAFLPHAETWADYRWYTDRRGTPELGTDFELGARAPVFSSPRFAFAGLLRMLYQSRHLEEYRNPFVFSPRHITTDLRLLGYGNFDPVVVYGGWRHDCTHTVDSENTRTPIHDTILAGGSYKTRGVPWRNPRLRSAVQLFAEGELNVPAAFTDSDDLVDRGRVTVGADLEPLAHEKFGALFVDGSASLIFRDTDSRIVEGIQRSNLDWSVNVGYRTPRETSAGVFSIYVRIERLTDPWISREVHPVTVPSVGALLHVQ